MCYTAQRQVPPIKVLACLSPSYFSCSHRSSVITLSDHIRFNFCFRPNSRQQLRYSSSLATTTVLMSVPLSLTGLCPSMIWVYSDLMLPMMNDHFSAYPLSLDFDHRHTIDQCKSSHLHLQHLNRPISDISESLSTPWGAQAVHVLR